MASRDDHSSPNTGPGLPGRRECLPSVDTGLTTRIAAPRLPAPISARRAQRARSHRAGEHTQSPRHAPARLSPSVSLVQFPHLSLWALLSEPSVDGPPNIVVGEAQDALRSPRVLVEVCPASEHGVRYASRWASVVLVVAHGKLALFDGRNRFDWQCDGSASGLFRLPPSSAWGLMSSVSSSAVSAPRGVMSASICRNRAPKSEGYILVRSWPHMDDWQT